MKVYVDPASCQSNKTNHMARQVRSRVGSSYYFMNYGKAPKLKEERAVNGESGRRHRIACGYTLTLTTILLYYSRN